MTVRPVGNATDSSRVTKRVGHKGADHIVPGNTLESFQSALDHGVDMIEFDVLAAPGKGLVLAHDLDDAARREPVTLADGLDHFATGAYANVLLDVDLKGRGNEREVVDALQVRGLTDRVLISSMHLESLAIVKDADQQIRVGWSVPKVRRDWSRSRFRALLYPWLIQMRMTVPSHAERLIEAGEIDAVMAYWRLVTPRLIDKVRAAGGEIFVWTVDSPAEIRRFEMLGVDGVITNDPRLFDAL